MTDAGALIGWLVVGLAAGRAARRAADRDRDRMRRRGDAVPGPVAWDGAGIEAVCALVLVALAAQLGWGWPVVPFVGLVATLAAVTITDLRHYRVPDRIVATGLAATTLAMGVIAATAGRPDQLRWAAVGALVFPAPLLAIHLAVPRGLGRGDVKLSVLLGAGIGWVGPPGLGTVLLVVWALIAACGIGLVAATVPRAARAARVPTGAIPFAPALSIATIGVVLAADLIVGYSLG